MRKVYVRSLKKNPKINKSKLKRLALKVLETENAPLAIEIGVTLVSNSYIRKLNQKYRKLDSPTDVLAFGIEVPGKKFLGDIYISLDMASLRARRGIRPSVTQGFILDAGLEVSRYLIHGILHLLGYKHGKQMKAREEYYLSAL